MPDRAGLIAAAREAMEQAYAPYSNFQVGCAVESVDGEVVTGANMENACYRLGICAEQSALAAAQHKFGLDKISRIDVAGVAFSVVCEDSEPPQRALTTPASSATSCKSARRRASSLLPLSSGAHTLTDDS